MRQDINLKKLIKIGVALFIVFALSMSIIWVTNRGYIEITVSAPSGSNTEYQLKDQRDGKITTGKVSGNTVKRLVKAGEYEVRVVGQENSYISVVKSGRLFSSVRVSAVTMREKQRELVGYNPAPCMQYVVDRLYTYECGDRVSAAYLHIPATSQTPTYVIENPSRNEAGIQDIKATSLGTVMLTAGLYDPVEEDLVFSPSLSLITNDLSGAGGIPQENIDPDTGYSLTPFGSGVALYSKNLKNVLLYDSLAATPQFLVFPEPKTDRSVSHLEGNNDKLVGFYSNDDVGDGEDRIVDGSITTDLFVYQNSTVATFLINQPLLAAAPCEKYICTLDYNNEFKVYEIADKKLQPILTLTGILEIHNSISEVIAVDKNGIIEFDLSKKLGSYAYTFGKYSYCGADSSGSSLLVCLIDSAQNKLALRLSPMVDVTLPIDKKVRELQTSKDIENVSAYGGFLYVTPKVSKTKSDDARTFNPTELILKQELLMKTIFNLELTQENGITVINTTSQN